MVNVFAKLDAYENCVVITYCNRFNVKKETAIKQIIRLFGINSLKAMTEDLKRGELEDNAMKEELS
jgi:hypothetical protein